MDKSRRSLFAAGVAIALTGLGQGCGGATAASDIPPPYPEVADVSGAAPELVNFFASFFKAKSLHDPVATMAHFSPQLVSYMDAVLGLDNQGFAALQGVFTRNMPRWPKAGLSYPTRILGDMNGAVVAFTDTPELFGGEIRAIGVVDFKDGKIVRWVDYWDARGWPNSLGYPIKTLADCRESRVAEQAAPALRQAADALQQAMAANDASAAAALFSSDAVYEDMALRLQIQGPEAIKRYFARALPTLPNGTGASLRHSVGSGQGGGYEWQARAGHAVQRGVTALVLDKSGKITRSTSVFDSTLLTTSQLQDIARLTFD